MVMPFFFDGVRASSSLEDEMLDMSKPSSRIAGNKPLKICSRVVAAAAAAFAAAAEEAGPVPGREDVLLEVVPEAPSPPAVPEEDAADGCAAEAAAVAFP